MIYFLYLSLVAALATPLFAIPCIIECVVGDRARGFQRWSKLWSRTMFALAGLKVKVHGTLDKSITPCVFAANHQNSLDIPAMTLALDVPFGFVSKASLEKVPFLGWALRISPSVFIDTDDARRSLASVKRAAEEIRSGSSVMIFPEGRRTWGQQTIAFKKRGIELAKEAGVPIVPVAIVNAYKLFDERIYSARPGVIDVVIGEPIPTGELSALPAREATALVRERVDRMIGAIEDSSADNHNS